MNEGVRTLGLRSLCTLYLEQQLDRSQVRLNTNYYLLLDTFRITVLHTAIKGSIFLARHAQHQASAKDADERWDQTIACTGARFTAGSA